MDEVYELFMDLGANDQQLDFPILYGIARQGIAVRDPSDAEGLSVQQGDTKLKHTPAGYAGLDITPLFDTIIDHCSPYPDLRNEPLQFQVSTLGYDDYIGRLGIGRITRGVVRAGQTVAVAQQDGKIVQRKIRCV